MLQWLHDGASVGRRAVRISLFKNSTFVDIREMYEKDGEERPGKKGGFVMIAPR